MAANRCIFLETWRSIMRTRIFLVAVCIGLGMGGTSGCGSGTRLEGLAAVEGAVTFQGKEVEGATVVFVPATATNRAAVGTTDAAGRFTLTTKDPGDGAAPGPHLITVSKTKTSGGLSAKEAEEWSRKRENFGKYPPRPTITELLPKKYKVVNTSGLQATVANGRNTIDLALEK